MHITSCSCDSRDCRDSRETLKYGSFGREKFGFRAMSRRIWKLCVASLLIILCFPGTQVPRFSSLIVHMFCSNVEIFGCLFWTALECFVARNCKCNSQMFPLFPWFGFMEVKSSERRRCITQLGVQQFSV